MTLTEMPFGLLGKVFSSPMPYSRFDVHGDLIHTYHQYDIAVVVMLVGVQESIRRAGRNLLEVYSEEGFKVIHLPIPDFGIPSKESLDVAIDALLDYLSKGENAAVHCNAGIGRTGTFLACLAKRTHAITVGEAVNWIRQYLPEAVETPEQALFVQNYSIRSEA
jgi:atypical dual specificity phosphatase